MNEILLVINNSNCIEYANTAVERRLAYTKLYLEGTRIEKLLGDNWNIFNQKILTPLTKGDDRASMETALITSYGDTIPVNFSATAYRDINGRLMGIVGVATDIRNLKELLNVSAERNKLSAILDSITDGVIALDPKGTIILVNNAALTLLDLSLKEIVGKQFDEILKLEDVTGIIKAENLLPQNEVLTDSIIYIGKGVQITTLNSSKANVNLISSSLKEGPSVGVGTIITIHDVTKEKQLEEMKLDFVSMAAHELRTPLTSIRGYLQVFESSNLDKGQKLCLERITQSSSQLSALVDNLLNITKIEKGVFTINATSVDLMKLITQTIDGVTNAANAKKISITIKDVSEKLPTIKADQLRITEVLNNLLSNAINYTDNGGEITVWTEKDKDEVTVHVKDTGKGIPKEAIPRLFTKFYRVNTTLEQEAKGSGLGLYITKSILDLHKGRIWVESELGRGSTFSFSLPIAQ